MDSNSWMHRVSAKRFIVCCKGEFGWEDLSRDVIMDVGCGVRGYGGQMILELFPAVGTIIGISKDQEEVDNLKETTKKIEFAVADIEKRETLQNYEGWITKVISIHVFHQIMEKEEAFRNIPLVEARRRSCSFVRYQVGNIRMVDGNAQKSQMERCLSGFQEVQCLGEERELAYPSDKDCKEALYKMYGKSFNISSELLDEFKEESFQVLLRLSKRNEDGKPCYRFTEMSFLFIKPTDGFASETS
ncbi:unnamed protein product [Larinioides sclopetarius]|uniref:Methyltransferase n=1 Tax=Larinioides sclopetarius TaxID=280406 RepID=A0AAV2A581_9ARAC